MAPTNANREALESRLARKKAKSKHNIQKLAARYGNHSKPQPSPESQPAKPNDFKKILADVYIPDFKVDFRRLADEVTFQQLTHAVDKVNNSMVSKVQVDGAWCELVDEKFAETELKPDVSGEEKEKKLRKL